jgi:hypothetical protein
MNIMRLLTLGQSLSNNIVMTTRVDPTNARIQATGDREPCAYLSPDAIDMVGIFQNSVLSVSACADGVVSISNVSAPTVTDARCDSMAKAISRLKGTTLRTGQVAMLPLEADSFDFEVVHVGRDIGELKLAGRRRFGFLAVKRQIIRQIHGGPRDNSAARIGDSPTDGSRAAQGYKHSPCPKISCKRHPKTYKRARSGNRAISPVAMPPVDVL